MVTREVPRTRTRSPEIEVEIQEPKLTWRQLKAAEDEAAKKERAERERVAREDEKRIAAEVDYLSDQWIAFGKSEHDTPPELLPLEAANEFPSFCGFVSRSALRTISEEAFSRFKTQRDNLQAASKRAVDQVTSALKWGWKSIATLGFIANRYSEVEVSIIPPKLSDEASKTTADAAKFLRTNWSTLLDRDSQGIVSVHQHGGVTYIHFGSGRHGSMYIKLPTWANSSTAIETFLKKIAKPLRHFFSNKSLIAVVDGEFQNINFKSILTGDIVVRSYDKNTKKLSDNISKILTREPISPSNTQVISAIPNSEDEQSAVFKSSEHWNLWEGIADQWVGSAIRLDYPIVRSSSKESILQALSASKNVVIIVAHADAQVIYLPAPPPEGSTVSEDDFYNIRDKILSNAPMVYLFCCESAQTGDFRSLTEALLDCGAMGVAAPQAKINPERYRPLFERLLRKGSSDGPLGKLFDAEQVVGTRDMEVWLG
ncbi:hypothetical protein [Mesorhizobium neociceri]|uniref:CHAT domain-containing protein n=1 Tax=Mesorhizobium neociceri TaxID=1307853 RepID=A0A838BDN2_9HYPH|nr:hypothetical protein [Mesorhizobium neociceri]MBA1144187.1 hypothetical protein [Mesorhizobium neociceri]